MTEQKPLPAIPTASNLMRLSLKAREHRARFIRFVLSELDDSWIERNQEEWATTLEDVLDDLGDSVGHGHWLSGIKKGRMLKRKRTSSKMSSKSREKENEVDEDQSSSSSSTRGSTEVTDSLRIEDALERLQQLREVAAQPDVPSRTPKCKHLLLCLAPLGSKAALPDEDSGFDLVPANLGCTFRTGVFLLPEDSDEHDGAEGLLYGFREWDTTNKETSTCLVGGTFTLKGVPSPQHFAVLSKALKLSIYVHLSLLLEQHLLKNSHVQLTFVHPRARVPSSYGSSQIASQPSSSHDNRSSIASASSGKSRNRNNLIPNGILSFFSKRSLGRSVTQREESGGRSSTDLVAFPSMHEDPPHRASLDENSTASRLRRFSFMSPTPLPQIPTEPSLPFTATLSRIEAQKNLLSSSVGVVIQPPMLLVRFAEKEKAHPDNKVHLLGDERVALSSLLGWGVSNSDMDATEDDKDTDRARLKGKGMAGICGFVHQQEISMLVSSHVPYTRPAESTHVGPEASTSSAASSGLSVPREASSSSSTSEGSDSSTGNDNNNNKAKVVPSHAACEPPHWATYRYFSQVGEDDEHEALSSSAGDRCLGEVITEWIDEADIPCSRLRAVPVPEHKGGIGIVPARMPGLGAAPTEKQCEVNTGKHERRFVHGGVRISVNIDWPCEPGEDDKLKADSGSDSEAPDEFSRKIHVWESCAVCGAQTEKNEMSDGAYLFSFAKYMELLIYSPVICALSPSLCEHTTPSSPSISTLNLPPERFNIVRHFSAISLSEPCGASSIQARDYIVSFKSNTVEDIFELRPPRLQIVRGETRTNPVYSRVSLNIDDGEDEVASGESRDDAGKKKLRREIKAWWEGIADHMDLLEDKLSTDDKISLVSMKKALPRLPSADDAYDDFDTDPEEQSTPKPTISGLPDTSTPLVASQSKDYFDTSLKPSPTHSNSTTPSASTASLTPVAPRPPLNTSASSASTSSTVSNSTAVSSNVSSISSLPSVEDGPALDPMLLLSNLRQTFHRTEQTLYTQLLKTPPSSLNDVRRAFLSAARGAERRLVAWQKKHLVVNKKRASSKDKHAIAELNPSEKLRAAEPEWWNQACHVVPGGNIIIREDDWGSIIAFTMSTPEYHQELSSMSVSRSNSYVDLQSPNTPMATSSNSPSSFFSAATATGYKLFRTSALIQPDPDQEDVIWHEPEAYSAVISRKEHPRDPTSLLSIREVLRHKSPDSNILSGSRFASLGSSTSKLMSGNGRPSMLNGAPPSAWAKPDVQVSKQEAEGEVASGLSEGNETMDRVVHELEMVEGGDTESRDGASMIGSYPWSNNASTIKRGRVPSAMSDATIGPDDAMSIADTELGTTPLSGAAPISPTPIPPKSSLSSLTSGLTNAMRLVLPTQISRPLSAGSNRHHGLLSADVNNPIDERPHIKYDWTIGKRLKFSCTVYYAKQFDSLRKRCGINSIYLESLSKSTNWSADGGKSKSNFWKTADDRFIIKTLVNAWNVADLQVLIELGPAYFRYMESTASKATVLAKLIGFYTIEIRNLETGAIQSKADLLVMENLFYDQNVDKTFDLKGIQGRKVKAGTTGQVAKTLFDGEWIEGQQQTLTLVRPHSKAVLREAIKSDSEFLSKSNIMDYSLLLGIDTEHKQIACGLVDTIGSYTFAKTLEYKAKQGLSSGSGKEVTVIPPAEYQDRFLNALEKYFLACPDKWSRPLDGRKVISDYNRLPSVL